MPRLGVLNMLIGFSVLALAACAGAFMATDIRDAFLHDQAILSSWQYLVQASSHGHTNMFALLHVAFGLTLPYSRWSQKIKTWQTVGLGMGTFAMGPLMIWRSYVLPSGSIDLSGGIIAVFLTAALLAIAVHAAGLASKWLAHA